MKNISNNIVRALCVLAVSLVTGCTALAWTEPSSTAPAGNVAAPINSGSATQTKTGSFIIGNTNWSQLQFYPAVNDAYNPITGGGDRSHFHFSFPSTPGGKEPLIETPSDFWVIGASHNLVADGYVETNTGFCIGSDCRTSWNSITGPWTVLGNNIHNNNTGNVGIGTASPGYKLQVNGDIYANGGWLRTSGGAGWYSESYGGGWHMSDTSWIRSYNGKSIWLGGGLLGSDGGLTVGYGGAGSPSRGAIISGNVGIGTASPGAKLHVAGNLLLDSTLHGAGRPVDWANINGGSYAGYSYYAYTSMCVHNNSGYCDAAGGVVLGRTNASATTNFPSSGNSFINAGNVGIGTASPGAKLDVAGALRFSSVDCIAGLCPPNQAIRLTPNLHLNSGAGNAVILNWDNGTTGGSQTFRIGNGAGSDVFYVLANGSTYASAFYYTSDERLKKNIAPISESLGKLEKLNGVYFNWKSDNEPSMGLIAQDLEKVFPEAVSTNAQTGFKSVDYGKMVAPLIEAIKEQQQEITDLKSQINELRQAISISIK